MLAVDRATQERERIASIARMETLLEILWEQWADGSIEAGSRILQAADLHASLSGDAIKLIQATRLLGVTEDEQHD